jgi:transcriptional regulator with XRE-family HTH domain
MTTRRANGPAIRALREALGMRQDELAARLKITAPHLSRIERGLGEPSPALLRRIADHLGVPLPAVSSVPGDERVPA